MFDRGSSFESIENKNYAPEKVYSNFKNLYAKFNELFIDDIPESNEFQELSNSEDTIEIQDGLEKKEINNNDNIDQSCYDFKDLFDKLFFDDLEDSFNNILENNIENVDPTVEKIENSIGTPDGIKNLIEKHPEKAELWENQLEHLEILNDQEASPIEIRSAQSKLSILKGQLMETAVKDAFKESGFDVEEHQRVVEGESGGTRPDVIAKNNTNNPIEVFGVAVESGKTLSVECKCGGVSYIKEQLNNHIPNQLSGQEGRKILLTTSDIKYVQSGLAKGICEKYGAELVVPNVSVCDVENAIKEVAK